MEYEILIQLGIAGATLYILREYLLRTDERIDMRDQQYLHYIQENNHKITNLIVEATGAIRASTEAVIKSTKAVDKIYNEDKNSR